MNAATMRALTLRIALAVLLAGCPSKLALVAAGQATNPQQQPTTPAKPKPVKKPDEPIDPDATAGVRGPGSSHVVRVLRKGKPIQGAHVSVKNTNGSLAASCYTSATGECQVDVGADSYIIGATSNGRTGTVSQPVDDSTGPIVIDLVKVKTGSSAPKL